MVTKKLGSQKYVGRVYDSCNCGKLVIVQYNSPTDVYIRFIDTGYETKSRITNILSGKVKDKLLPSVYGVGVVGEKMNLKERGKNKEYNLWVRMLDRCYSDKEHISRRYKDCVVSDNFKYFPYFKEWCNKQVGFGCTDEKGNLFALDKDILSTGSSIYSENTCVFVPQEINNQLTNTKISNGNYGIGVSLTKSGKYKASISKYGKTTNIGIYETDYEANLAYKQAKEAHIKELANKWKDQIDPRAYEVLISWNVEITD